MTKPGVKINWSPKMLSFLEENYQVMTNKQLAEGLGLRLTSVRTTLYSMGYKRMELEYWTKAQINYLYKHYHTKGDSELAEIFNSKWHKEKTWTKKHIEKKRRYLKLKRTESEKKKIHERNRLAGRFAMCPLKAWETRGQAPDGEIRIWKPNGNQVPMIKIKGKWVRWSHWYWEKHRGPIKKGMNVIFKDRNPFNRTIRNLAVITNAELSLHNSKVSATGLSDNYVAGIMSHRNPEMRELLKARPDLIQLKRNQLLLNRQIQQHEQI
jgi:hypothetical protein